jgi:hypothetical protein
MSTPQLTVVTNHRQAYELLTDSVRRALPDRDRVVNVLEAGCGRSWALGDLDAKIHLTGIDLDAEALRLRIEEKRDLDEAIHGDLMSVQVKENYYDLVFSSFVLEHLERPRQALDRFFSWSRSDGLVAVIIPDRDTGKGFATRLSPFKVHVWYYRWIKRRKTAGKPGYEPYRTFYGAVVGRAGLEEYCATNGHRIVDEIAIAMNTDDDGRLATVSSKVIGWLSFGRLRGDYCNLAVVMAKE